MDIVLASASPRRRALLEMLGVKGLTVFPASAPEAACEGMSPEDTVLTLSLHKALEVAPRFSPETVVIAADTVVELCGDILGKPVDAADAGRMLKALSGRTHRVFTGLAVLRGERRLSGVERTEVRFRRLSEREIDAYVSTGEPMDKAGAYGAQGIAGLFVEGINGDFFNVMGLPLCRLGTMLSELGVELL